MKPADWTVIAERQGGIVTRAQLVAMGHGSPSVDGMLRRGRLARAHDRFVYRTPGAPITDESERWIAALATRSPISYLTAARVWDVPVPDDGYLHITRLDRRRFDSPAGVRVHRVLLDPGAVTTRAGLPVTTRTETLLDCLGWLRLGDARTLADRAKQQRWLSVGDLERRLRNEPGRWGNSQLRLMLANMGDDAHSEAERRLHQLLRQAGIVGWSANRKVTVAGQRYVVDLAFPRARLAIEVDGYRTHSDIESFQGDRTKSARLTAAGWTVLRFTWGDLVDRPRYVLSTISALLAV